MTLSRSFRAFMNRYCFVQPVENDVEKFVREHGASVAKLTAEVEALRSDNAELRDQNKFYGAALEHVGTTGASTAMDSYLIDQVFASDGAPGATPLPKEIPFPHWMEEGDLKRVGDSLAPVAQSYARGMPGMASMFLNGSAFLGFQELAALSTSQEYRKLAEIWANECTRKWITVTGADSERVAAITKEMERLNVRGVIYKMIEHDCQFGRGNVYIGVKGEDTVRDSQTERTLPLAITAEAIPVGSLEAFRNVEPFFCYPGVYNASDPVAGDFYRPKEWLIANGAPVHSSRMLLLVSRPVPDILKPAFMWAGISMTQMAKPYIDTFLRNRKSGQDLLHSFATMVFSTDMTKISVAGGSSDGSRASGFKELATRLKMFVTNRNTNGVFAIHNGGGNNDSAETLTNVSAPISGVRELIAQSQEQICSITSIPLVIYTGISPGGLNASSEGDIKIYHNNIMGYNERNCTPVLTQMLRIIQLNMDGVIDENIGFVYNSLWDIDDADNADVDSKNVKSIKDAVDSNMITPEEGRDVLVSNENSAFHILKKVDKADPAREEVD